MAYFGTFQAPNKIQINDLIATTPFVGMSFTKIVYHNTTTEFSFLWNKWHHYPEYAHDQRQHSNTKQTAKIIIRKMLNNS